MGAEPGDRWLKEAPEARSPAAPFDIIPSALSWLYFDTFGEAAITGRLPFLWALVYLLQPYREFRPSFVDR
jgi:hypothetical protein